MREVNQAGLDLIKEYEGFKPKAYLCPGKVWTIGYGTTKGVKPGDTITKEQAEERLKQDIKESAQVIEKLVKVNLTDNQFAALVSFVYNVGQGNFRKSSLLKKLNMGWYETVPIELNKWNRDNGEVLGGLARRRAAEGRLFNKREC